MNELIEKIKNIDPKKALKIGIAVAGAAAGRVLVAILTRPTTEEEAWPEPILVEETQEES